MKRFCAGFVLLAALFLFSSCASSALEGKWKTSFDSPCGREEEAEDSPGGSIQEQLRVEQTEPEGPTRHATTPLPDEAEGDSAPKDGQGIRIAVEVFVRFFEESVESSKFGFVESSVECDEIVTVEHQEMEMDLALREGDAFRRSSRLRSFVGPDNPFCDGEVHPVVADLHGFVARLAWSSDEISVDRFRAMSERARVQHRDDGPLLIGVGDPLRLPIVDFP